MRNIFQDYKIFNIDARKSRSNDFYKNVLANRDYLMKKFSRAIKKPSDFVCLLCQNRRGLKFLNYKNYLLLECARCGLVSPNINFELISGEDVYDSSFAKEDVKKEILNTYDYRKKTYAPERLEYILEKTKFPANKINLLDVGCGPGYFLAHLKEKKIKYKGLELADFLVDICQKKKLNVVKADLKNEPPKTYNILTLFDVLEHIPDPISFFKTMNDKLVRGGYVLAYTPNIHSLAYALMREHQNTLYPFQHLCFFDKKSLDYLAKKTGFKVHSIDYYGLDVIDYLCMKVYEDNCDYLKKMREFIPIMQAIIDKQELSNHMRVIFKKAKDV